MKKILASQILKGQNIIENTGCVFPVLSVLTDTNKTIVKIDTSMYFLSFRTNTKEITLKSNQTVLVCG